MLSYNKPIILRLERGILLYDYSKNKSFNFSRAGDCQIENMIESGLWKVGEKIPAEPELMNKFDVSRNTLREAIQSLVHVGMLETRQGIGTIVKSNSNLGMALEKKIQKSDLLETLEVRLALEREAAQLAAERRDVEDLEQIETCLKNVR